MSKRLNKIKRTEHGYHLRNISRDEDFRWVDGWVQTFHGIVRYFASKHPNLSEEVLWITVNGFDYELRQKIEGLPGDRAVVRRCSEFAKRVHLERRMA